VIFDAEVQRRCVQGCGCGELLQARETAPRPDIAAAARTPLLADGPFAGSTRPTDGPSGAH
jgi:hypothetical protein